MYMFSYSSTHSAFSSLYNRYKCTITNNHNIHRNVLLVDGTVGRGVLCTHTVASLLGISCDFVEA